MSMLTLSHSAVAQSSNLHKLMARPARRVKGEMSHSYRFIILIGMEIKGMEMPDWVTFEKKCSAIELLAQINNVSSRMTYYEGPSQMD